MDLVECHEADVPTVIRAAMGNDLEGVLEVGARTWPATYRSILSEDVIDLLLRKKWTAAALTPEIRSGRMIVAESDRRIVGMASWGAEGSTMVVWRLYVVPEHQHRGVGSHLVDALLDIAAADYDAVAVSFSDHNAVAYDFARLHGFAESRREPQSGMPDLIWMRRPTGVSTDREGVA